MKRRSLSASEFEALLPRLRVFLGDVNVKKVLKRGVDAVELEDVMVLSVAGFFFVVGNEWVVPALVDVNKPLIDRLASVWVDMGAVPRVASGADVMRPGIVRMDVFQAGDEVVVRDITHSKPLAVGQALMSSEKASALAKGKVVKNLHHIDDAAWKALKQVL
ncbi:MAG: PUA domain-containing protein [Candidatus Caldarchaeum sp.]